ncbi:conserved hypothetical protein [Vibrio owensii]|uniref:hypothetical protein n=1 Tax=Vibrio owensii TaxID=696485 RepID=UPI0028954A3C|nr:conserved hypothetical protein [Vibrio owensii]CAH1579410.1 conserved hypothetical protein [Vibrio owensii]CAH1579584.1 conserved hypothetical protein [Vibrio owensii]
MSMNRNETDFTQILNGYFGVDEQEQQWKATCASLELLKHTLKMNSSADVITFSRQDLVAEVTKSIRNSLEKSS